MKNSQLTADLAKALDKIADYDKALTNMQTLLEFQGMEIKRLKQELEKFNKSVDFSKI